MYNYKCFFIFFFISINLNVSICKTVGEAYRGTLKCIKQWPKVLITRVLCLSQNSLTSKCQNE